MFACETKATDTLDLALAGCAEITEGAEGPTCHLADAPPRVWVGSVAELEVEGASPRREPSVGGTLLTFPADTRGSVRIRAGRAEGQFRFAHHRVSEAYQAAVDARASGDLEAARTALEASPAKDATDAARRNALRARIALSAGESERAIRALRASEEENARLGRTSAGILDGVALAHLHRTLDWNFEASEKALERAAARATFDAEGATRIAYHRALLERDRGDVRHASRAFEAAAERARRLGPAEIAHWSDQQRARLLHRAGRSAEAYALLDGLAAQVEAPCARAHVWTDIGWLSLQDASHRQGPIRWSALRGAASAYERCPHARDRRNAHLNLALGALLEQRPRAASTHLERAAAAGGSRDRELEVWTAVARARLAAGSEEIVKALEGLAATRAWPLPPHLAWRVHHERALLFRTRASRCDCTSPLRDAAAAFAEAERAAEREHRLLSIEGGREALMGTRSASALAHVEVLIELGEVREAWTVARRTRARALRALTWRGRLAALPPERRRAWGDALRGYREGRTRLAQEVEAQWALSGDDTARAEDAWREREKRLRRQLDEAYAELDPEGGEASLPAAEEGVLSVAFFPREDGRSRVFEAFGDRLRTRTLEGTTAAAAHHLWDELDLRDGAAPIKRIRLLPYGAWRAIDLHALPVRGGAPLGTLVPVVYGLDLPAPPRRGTGGMVVVADPRGDLEDALREGEAVARGADAALLSGERADLPAVLAALGDAGTFYYAGHGRAAEGGFDSGLPLAGDGLLAARDLLALPRVPTVAVLSGCETARASLGSDGETLGLAQAFVVAGARRVIATTRRVPDEVASRFAAALGPPFDPESFRAAAAALRETDPQHWASYRMLVP